MIHLLLTVLRWLGVGVLMLVAVVVLWALLEAALEAVSRRRGRQLPPVPVPPGRPVWTLTLLIDVDEGSSLVRPSVQISGPPRDRGASVRIDMVDAWQRVRLTLGRDFPPEGIGADVPLPAFVPPQDLSLSQVLRCRWDVVFSDRDGELGRWEEWPAPVEGITTEGEIRMPDEGRERETV